MRTQSGTALLAVLLAVLLATGGPSIAADRTSFAESYAKVSQSLVLCHFRDVSAIDFYSTGLVVARNGDHAFVITATGTPLPFRQMSEVLTGPDFSSPHPAKLIRIDDGTAPNRTSWTLGLELYDVPNLAAPAAVFAQNDVHDAVVGIAGYANSSVALWKLLTHTLRLRVIESMVGWRGPLAGSMEFRGEPGFSNGGAVAFDERSGTVLAVLGAVGPLENGGDYDGHSPDAIAAFLAPAHLMTQRTSVEAAHAIARDRQMAATLCLQGKNSTTTEWNQRTTKPANGAAVVVASGKGKSYLLTLISQKALDSVEGAMAPQKDSLLYPVSVVARDQPTGMTLLSIDGPDLTSTPILESVSAAEGVTALYLGMPRSVFSPCSEQPTVVQSGFVNAVHDGGDVFEHSGGSFGVYRGSPLFDSATGALVGVASEYVKDSNDDFLAYGPTFLRRFLMKNGIDPVSQAPTATPKIGYFAAESSLVRIFANEARGSGVTVGSASGAAVVLTAAHVVSGESAEIFTPSKRGPLIASVLKRDGQHDLLLLRIPGVSLPALPLAFKVAIGDPVGTAGYPGTSYEFSDETPKVNQGIVSSLYAQDFFEHTAATDSGNSGGPVFSPNSGCLYGIVLGVIPPGGLVTGVANSGYKAYYAASINRIRAFLASAKVQLPQSSRC